MNIEKEINDLLASDISAYRIAKDSGVAQPVITKLRNGNRKVSNLTVESAQKLLDYWETKKTTQP